jgi:hypothetical protein
MLETLTPQGGFCIACILEKRVTWAGPRSITLKTEYNKQTQESNIPTLETLAVGDVETGPKPQEQRRGKTLVEAVGVAAGGGGGAAMGRSTVATAKTVGAAAFASALGEGALAAAGPWACTTKAEEWPGKGWVASMAGGPCGLRWDAS